MAWYYYNGNTTRPVEVDENKTKSVKPHSKINIIKMGPLGKSLLNKKLLTRTSKPVDANKEEARVIDAPKMEEVVKVAPWAQAVSERGSIGSAAELIEKIKTEVSSVEPKVIESVINEDQNGQNTENNDTIKNDDADAENSGGRKKRKPRRQG